MSVPPDRIERIAVLGAGTIGASWAAWFLARGKRVALHDPNPGAEGFARRFIFDAWPTLTRLGLDERADPGAWTFHGDPAEAVRDAQFVQENAPERLAIKRDLYAAIEPALPDDAILASSSSGITMSELQQGFRAAPRMAIGHPFNPPHLIPLVEVVGGRDTAPETIAWCLDFYTAIGKRPIHIRKEAPGHLANRLQAALYREAVSAVVSGLASVEDVDTAITAGPGLRWALMGPHMTFHLGGGEGGMVHMLDQFGPVFEGWWASMGTPALTDGVRRQIIEGVRDAAHGRSIAELAAERDALLVALMRLIGDKN
ncbi:MAG: 3-hydroxyacyl-CoA dehydrogenase NAD-binding domain-containing protein [Acetobacteraceae bacterium]